jgi:G3E family GTPase
MELIVISGFLASGKTSLLLMLARAFVAQGRKIAIIENEVSRNGVDGEQLKAEGLDVREIYAGCVCCSLRHDLIQTLLELERTVNPDVVFLEPSGVAGPKQIQHCLCGYGGEIDKQTHVVVADAKRLPVIEDFSIPLISDGLEIADLVAINKSDLVSEEQLQALKGRVRDVNPDVEMLCVSATEGTQMEELIKKITARPAGAPEVSPAEHAFHDLPEASVFTDSISMDSIASDAAAQISAMLESLSCRLKKEDGIFIGHLKVILKTQPIGYCVCSVTEENGTAVQKGRLAQEDIRQAVVTLNAIVYGAEDETFSNLCKKSFQTLEQSLAGDL